MMTFKKTPAPIPPSPTTPLDMRTIEFICSSCGIVHVPRSALDAASPHSEVGVTPMTRRCDCGALARRVAMR